MSSFLLLQFEKSDDKIYVKIMTRRKIFKKFPIQKQLGFRIPKKSATKFRLVTRMLPIIFSK
jgi:hypothetical protein